MSCLSDTKPELALHRILEPLGNVTGCMNPVEVEGKTYSYDRKLTWSEREDGKYCFIDHPKEILFEVNADHNWKNSEKKDEVKRVLLLKSHSLIDVFLNAKQIEKWKEIILTTVKTAMKEVESGKKVYYAVYLNDNTLTVSDRVNDY